VDGVQATFHTQACDHRTVLVDGVQATFQKYHRVVLACGVQATFHTQACHTQACDHMKVLAGGITESVVHQVPDQYIHIAAGVQARYSGIPAHISF
jgi:hypothetical protein